MIDSSQDRVYGSQNAILNIYKFPTAPPHSDIRRTPSAGDEGYYDENTYCGRQYPSCGYA